MDFIQGIVTQANGLFTMSPRRFFNRFSGLTNAGVPAVIGQSVWRLDPALSAADIKRIAREGLQLTSTAADGSADLTLIAPAIIDADQMADWLVRLSRTYQERGRDIEDFWSVTPEHDAAKLATKRWWYMAPGSAEWALSKVAADAREGVVAHLENLPAQIMWVWYNVMLADDDLRTSYSQGAVNNPFTFYTDLYHPSTDLAADPVELIGTPRGVDGAYNALTGSGSQIPLRYNPGQETLRNAA